MRVFYIFKINKEFITLTERNPYTLYKTLESLYYLKTDDLDLGYSMFKEIVNTFDKVELNNYFFKKYKEDEHYTKYNNRHMLNNFYTDEQSKLVINKTFLVLKTTKVNPTFFKDLRKINSLFVCDFKNKDYFWLEQVI